MLTEAFEGAYGQKLAPVDLAVVDEAHRTSGSMGKTWADIHDQTKIPAHRRLHLTATPRIWEERLNREVAEGVRDPLPREMKLLHASELPLSASVVIGTAHDSSRFPWSHHAKYHCRYQLPLLHVRKYEGEV